MEETNEIAINIDNNQVSEKFQDMEITEEKSKLERTSVTFQSHFFPLPNAVDKSL